MRRERMYVRLPIGLLFYHAKRVRLCAEEAGKNGDEELGKWTSMIAEAIAVGELEGMGEPFLEELADFTDKDVGGGRLGNQNAKKKTTRRKAKGESEDEES